MWLKSAVLVQAESRFHHCERKIKWFLLIELFGVQSALFKKGIVSELGNFLFVVKADKEPINWKLWNDNHHIWYSSKSRDEGGSSNPTRLTVDLLFLELDMAFLEGLTREGIVIPMSWIGVCTP
jgi:hypothetical protein